MTKFVEHSFHDPMMDSFSDRPDVQTPGQPKNHDDVAVTPKQTTIEGDTTSGQEEIIPRENDALLKEAKREESRHRRELLKSQLTPDNLSIFDETLGNTEGDPSKIFDPHDRVMHTTNSFAFDQILSDGKLVEGLRGDGSYKTRGVSFSDGDSEVALAFQTLMDDQSSRSTDKRLNSSALQDKVEGFVSSFWNDPARQSELCRYLGELTKESPPQTLAEAVRLAERFHFQATPKEIADNAEALGTLFGVTLVYKKEALPELSKGGTDGIQRDFELRSNNPEGVPINLVETILVPANRIQQVQEQLRKQGLEGIKVQASEELEARRMLEISGQSAEISRAETPL